MVILPCLVEGFSEGKLEEKSDLVAFSAGFSVAVIDEDGTQQLHITEVKAEGLAAAKGTNDSSLLLHVDTAAPWGSCSVEVHADTHTHTRTESHMASCQCSSA